MQESICIKPSGTGCGKIILVSGLLDLLQILLHRLPSVLSSVKPVLANGIFKERNEKWHHVERDVHLSVGKLDQSDSCSITRLPASAGLFVNGGF